MRIRVAAAAAFLAACSSSAGSVPGVAPRASHGRTHLVAPVSIRPVPPVRYAFHRLDTITTRLPNGMESPQVIGRTLLLTVSITPPPPGTVGEAHLAIHLDSVAIDSGTPEMARAPFEGMVGTTWNGSVSSSGGISDLSPDHSSAGVEVVTPDLERWLPILPSAGVRAGDAWTDTLISAYPFSNLSLQVAETLIAGWHATDGIEPGTVDLVSSGPLTRSGSSSVVTLLGNGARTAQYTLGADGALVAAGGADSVLMKISVKAVGQSVTVRQLGHFSVTRRP